MLLNKRLVFFFLQGNTSRFPLVVCVVQKLLELDGIIKYEEAIKIPGLIVEFPFSIADIIVFSHKWCSRTHPDYSQKNKIQTIKKHYWQESFSDMRSRFGWTFFLCPHDDQALKQQALDSFCLYVTCCKYFVILIGCCRLERFAALSPLIFQT